VYGGMRDVESLVTDISYVDPTEGIRLRGFTIPELVEQLPRRSGDLMPLVGGLYYLLLVGEIPTLSEALEVEDEWKLRSEVPDYVFEILTTMPECTQPMTLFTQAILSLQCQSIFAQQHDAGARREDYWNIC
jgi:citrate synthase